jgi:arylsulfatase
LNTDRFRNYFPDTVEEMLKKLDEAGGPSTDPHYPMGWAMAGNSPLKRWKQDTHAGGNTDPFIIAWPAKIKDAGGIRHQYHHVTDVVPTIMEVTGLPTPSSVNGVKQMPMHGVSMAYTFADASAKTRKQVQHYEMLGSRAIWADGWTAVTWHKKDTPWEADRWELYNTEVDFPQANDLAARHPEKLQALISLWETEAKKYNVFPLDDRRYERVADPTRPVATLPKKQYTYYPGTSILHPLAGPQILGVEHTITAHVTIPAKGAEGVLACSGGEFGGWTLFLKEGRFHYVHNYLNLDQFAVSSTEAVPAGQHTLSVHFTPTEKYLKPDYSIGNVTMSVDGKPVAKLTGIKVAGQYSAVTGYGLLIGRNTGTPVSHEYKAPFAFTGEIDKVTIDLK